MATRYVFIELEMHANRGGLAPHTLWLRFAIQIKQFKWKRGICKSKIRDKQDRRGKDKKSHLSVLKR